MVKMNQGDLFQLIVELDFASQAELARAIESVKVGYETEGDEARISRIRRGGSNGMTKKTLMGSTMSTNQFAERIFKKIFLDCNIKNGAPRDLAYENFDKIKNYLIKNKLTFNRMDEMISDNSDENIERFITKMIMEAIVEREAHGKDAPTTSGKMVSEKTPTLHSQNILCPSKFYGRQDYLDKMRELICSYKLVVLSGIGGIGKTYLSRQYARTYRSAYNIEQIITYNKSSSSIKSAILSLKFDNLNDSDMSDNDKLEKRIDLLNHMSEDTLLIIDNVDTKPSDMECFNELRTNSNIHIIITTRLNDFFSSEQTLYVKSMSTENQLELFNSHYKVKITEEDQPVINDILKCIDGHTLLIELVAKSMHAGALSPSDMYSYLMGKGSETELLPVLINKDNLSFDKKMNDYVKLLFDIVYLDENAKEALLYLSLLPLDGVEWQLYYNLLPKYREGFNELIRNSWAIKDDNIIRLHPVIRDMIRKERKPSHENCSCVLSNIHTHLQTHLQTKNTKLSDYERQDICKIFHSISDIKDFYSGCDNITMLSFFAEFCFSSYDFSLALELYSITATIAEDSPIQTRTYLYLKIGDVYKRLARLKDSINSYKKALKSNARQQSGTEKSCQDADIYLLLSDIYRKDGQYDQAMNCNDTAINICENELAGKELLRLAEIYNRRGIIFLNKAESQGNEENREELFEKALEHYKKALDLRIKCEDRKEQLAYSYHNIGTTYNKLGYYDLALENHKTALTLREETQDISKTDIASSHLWLGNDYMSKGECFMELAKEHFETSLEIREAILGKTHPEVAWSLVSLSDWYKKSGDTTTALDLAERAYEIRINTYAPNHDYVLKSIEQIKKLKKLTL